MQFLTYIATALAVSVLSLGASADHVQRRQHQGLSRRMEGDLLESRATSGSRWSWYHTETGNAGSCGRMLRNSEFVVAMNVPQYKAGNCYKSITLSWRGKQTRAQIVDMCPGCPYGGLDLSPSLFQFFTGLGTGIISDGQWWFDGEGPGGAAPPPPKPTTTKSTSKWTPPPTPTPTPTTTRTRTRTSSTPKPTSTEEPEPTTTSSSTRTTSTTPTPTSQTSTSASETPSNTASLAGSKGDDGVQEVFSNLIALGGLVAAGANA
ncbi:hypothetical protein FA13DRAFT_1787658 [Coprinellus micaceus]|uniref:RlpA-like protein double-psi beta-barrel domain-containing protein n=1 Tax=Coprinellus micaceus TaxID=71717 RepID=A0A4Y7TPR9_COPMI|nr:hypothetical protein FA13DRAFT_1787658 [Coprinellus micaceus]